MCDNDLFFLLNLTYDKWYYFQYSLMLYIFYKVVFDFNFKIVIIVVL